MRLPELITREIQDLDKIRLSAIELSMQFPQDNILRLNVEQTEKRKELLINELDESLKFYGRHSLKYIFSDLKETIRLETLLEHLNSFKGLIDKTFEKITNGKQNNLPVNFNTVFSGSYGIQLSTPFEEKLLDHDYEKALGQTIGILTDLVTSSDEELNTIIEKDFGENRKLLNKYSLFFKKIHQNDKKVQIVWTSPISKELKSIIVEPEKAKTLYSRFSQKEKSEETVELLGILKGLSLIRYKVEFVKDSEGNDVITAKFDETLSEEVKDGLDKYVIARFKVSIEFNESKDEEEKRYELVSIHRR
jgi:hypothetical protein